MYLRNKGFATIIMVLLGLVIIVGGSLITTKTGTINLKNVPVLNSLPKADNTISPTPMPTATLKGEVVGGYYSKQIESVEIKAGNGTTKTNQEGFFEMSGIEPGNYPLSATHPEYTFDTLNIELKEGENNLEEKLHGKLTNPKPLSISGQIFSDKNENNVKDANDDPLKTVLSLYYKTGGKWEYKTTVFSNYEGKFSFWSSDLGEYRLSPGDDTFYDEPGPVEFVVDGYGGTKSVSFPYQPTTSQVGFKIYVFNDKNENGSRDSDEENIHYQYAEVINTTTSKNWKTGVSEDGVQESPADYGNYTIKLYPQDDSWAYYYKVTSSGATLTVDKTSGNQTVYLGAHKLY